MTIPPEYERCIFEFNDGRRCRGRRAGNGIFLCHPHLKVKERDEKRKADAAAAAAAPVEEAAAPPAGIFDNVHPAVASNFVQNLQEVHVSSATNINVMLERLLAAHLGNRMSARSLSATTSTIRLLLKTVPLVKHERLLEEMRPSTERFERRVQQALKEEFTKAAAKTSPAKAEPADEPESEPLVKSNAAD